MTEGEYNGRPAELRRAVHVTYLDGAKPDTAIIVLDDDAPPGGRTVYYFEAGTDTPTSAPEAPHAPPPSDPPTSPPQRSTGAHRRPRGDA